MSALAGLVRELTAARDEQDLTLDDVAQLTGYAASTISHWETGRATPSSDAFAAWASALGYQIGLYMAPEDDVAEPLPASTEQLFQELIGALASLFENDAAELQEAA